MCPAGKRRYHMLKLPKKFMTLLFRQLSANPTPMYPPPILLAQRPMPRWL